LHLKKDNNRQLVLQRDSGSTMKSEIEWLNQSGTSQFKIGIDSDNNLGRNWYLWDSVSSTYRLFVNSAGNVGIETTNPGYKLDVAGDIRSSGKTYLGTSGFYAQYEYKTSGDVAAAGWYRIAHIDGSSGRGQQQVTIYTIGGSYAPRSTTFRWYHDWSTNAGISVISEIGSGYWTDARVTDDGTNSFLEVYFTQAISGLNIGLQYIGGHDVGTLYSGTLPAGSGTVRATTKANGLFALNDKFVVDSSGNVGIGTTSPGYKLEVAGSFKSSSGGGNMIQDTSGNVIIEL
jgi:hypothetical protein